MNKYRNVELKNTIISWGVNKSCLNSDFEFLLEETGKFVGWQQVFVALSSTGIHLNQGIIRKTILWVLMIINKNYILVYVKGQRLKLLFLDYFFEVSQGCTPLEVSPGKCDRNYFLS